MGRDDLCAKIDFLISFTSLSFSLIMFQFSMNLTNDYLN
jgi:hypothetical protein